MISVKKLYNDLVFQVHRHVASQHPSNHDFFDFGDKEDNAEMNRVIYQRSGSHVQPDTFGDEVGGALEAISEVCRPKLERLRS